LSLALLLGLTVVGAAGTASDPHMDQTVVPGSCMACHRGHGTTLSPMLPAPQSAVCLSCHGSQSSRDKAALDRDLGTGARPQLMSSVLNQPFVHPISDEAYSRREPGVVTCTSCHSPHRGTGQIATDAGDVVVQKRSPRDPARLEFELCLECHGGLGPAARNSLEISGRLEPNSGSYHPVRSVASDGSPSVLPELTGREINCTDCHGNSDPKGPAGPHGSGVRFLLKSEYVTTDGSEESALTYALCYRCHQREQVLDSAVFPEHRRHVVDERASCATCHDAHGSVANRALIGFGEQTRPVGVSPSGMTGRLAFDSLGPGSGACYVSCHGYDHAPATYGDFTPDVEALIDPGTTGARDAPRTPGSAKPPWRRRREQ
jgi:predicted CXXCH cytochrome family protein